MESKRNGGTDNIGMHSVFYRRKRGETPDKSNIGNKILKIIMRQEMVKAFPASLRDGKEHVPGMKKSFVLTFVLINIKKL